MMENNKELFDDKKVKKLLSSLEQEGPPSYLWDRIEASIQAEEPVKNRILTVLFSTFFVKAAVSLSVLVLAIGLFAYHDYHTKQTANDYIYQMLFEYNGQSDWEESFYQTIDDGEHF
ncbi:hypothetical protein ACFL96_05260 [Thermoproteota archaeon]